ncbi:sugar nucleotide-binding protein [Candidatus Pelagibacter sp.]|nr:sugar nucleotide-binding protein [Candidatus Pelagibacter sp.]
MKKILVTGSTGRFGQVLKEFKTPNKMYYPSKKELNILDYKKILNYLDKVKPNYLIHLAGLSRPMAVHEKDIKKSIDLNIIGTANITKACEKKNIKLIYFSTHYVYAGIKGNYRENDPVNPVNNYAWSKLGGEASVKLYKNSLILRVCMTEKPFVHKRAFFDVKTNFLYHHDVVPLLFKVLDEKGVLNIGGKKQSIFNFAYRDNNKIKKIYSTKVKNLAMPKNSTLNLLRIKRLLNKKK